MGGAEDCAGAAGGAESDPDAGAGVGAAVGWVERSDQLFLADCADLLLVDGGGDRGVFYGIQVAAVQEADSGHAVFEDGERVDRIGGGEREGERAADDTGGADRRAMVFLLGDSVAAGERLGR